MTIFNYRRIDEMAILGYEYAAGRGRVPAFRDQMDIDAFNAGVSNYNVKHGTSIEKPLEGMKSKRIEGSNNR